jgi:hypothetical protein
MVITKKTNNKYHGGVGRKKEPSHTVVEMSISAVTMEIILKVHQKTKNIPIF